MVVTFFFIFFLPLKKECARISIGDVQMSFIEGREHSWETDFML